MKDEHLTQREVPHLGEAAIELLVGAEDPSGGGLKIGRRLGYEVPSGCRGQLVDRNLEPVGSLPEAAFGIVAR